MKQYFGAPRNPRGGRPRVSPGERSVSLTITVPESLYDRLTAQAQRNRLELAPYVRRLLGFQLKTSDDPTSAIP